MYEKFFNSLCTLINVIRCRRREGAPPDTQWMETRRETPYAYGIGGSFIPSVGRNINVQARREKGGGCCKTFKSLMRKERLRSKGSIVASLELLGLMCGKRDYQAKA